MTAGTDVAPNTVGIALMAGKRTQAPRGHHPSLQGRQRHLAEHCPATGGRRRLDVAAVTGRNVAERRAAAQRGQLDAEHRQRAVAAAPPGTPAIARPPAKGPRRCPEASADRAVKPRWVAT